MGCGTLIGLALSGAGAGLGVAGAEQTQSALNNTVGNQINAENQFSQKAQPIFQKALAGFQPQAAQQDIAQGQKQFTNAANTLQAAQSGFATNQNPVNTQATNARAQMGNQAMGQLAGYSNLPLQWQLQNQQAWPQLGVINQEAANRQSIYPALLQLAGRSGNQLQGWGQGLSGLGSLFGALGNMGGGSSYGGDWSQGSSTTPTEQ